MQAIYLWIVEETIMARHYQAQFDNSREMQASDFEIYYYEDKVLENVSMHRHDYYEIYFFILLFRIFA